MLHNWLMGGFNRISNFMSYWYMRYLLVTELYMVEEWERILIHSLMFTVFGCLSYINMKLIQFSPYVLSILEY